MKKMVAILVIFFAGLNAHAHFEDGLYANIYTNRGEILLALDYEKAPLTVINFVGLAEGDKLYGIALKEDPIHRIQQKMMAEAAEKQQREREAKAAAEAAKNTEKTTADENAGEQKMSAETSETETEKSAEEPEMSEEEEISEEEMLAKISRLKPFYDNLKFHRVVEDFVIQGGDPNGDGTGGPRYEFVDEISDLKHDAPGILSMANSGPNTNGSQFFITHRATPELDGKHTVFGRVIDGMDVVNNIQKDDTMHSIRIIRIGEAANAFQTDEDAFNEKLEEIIRAENVRYDERKEQFRAYMGENYPDAKRLFSFFYTITKTGTGRSPQFGDVLEVGIEIKNLDGEILSEREVVKVWPGFGRIAPVIEETVQKMQLGGTATAYFYRHQEREFSLSDILLVNLEVVTLTKP